ncbi:MAG: hypothetical protein ABMA25_01810 [Ilumatobacteraceae bacterium]
MNALFVRTAVDRDGVRFDLLLPRFLLGQYAPSRLEIRAADVERVYRCRGPFGGRATLIMRPVSGVKPTMISWRVASVMHIDAEVSHKSILGCFDALKTRNLL